MKPVGGRVTSLSDWSHKGLRFFARVLSNIATTSEKILRVCCPWRRYFFFGSGKASASTFGVGGADIWLGGFELPGSMTEN